MMNSNEETDSCPHRIEKEILTVPYKYGGGWVQTGDYVCTQCGKSFSPDELPDRPKDE
jgi:hypothetical protein